jgi:hypothetical protein
MREAEPEAKTTFAMRRAVLLGLLQLPALMIVRRLVLVVLNNLIMSLIVILVVEATVFGAAGFSQIGITTSVIVVILDLLLVGHGRLEKDRAIAGHGR